MTSLRALIFQLLLPLCFTLESSANPVVSHPLSDDDFINFINTQQSMWKARRNFPENTSLYDISGAILEDDAYEKLEDKKYDDAIIASLPEHFDPRDKWPYCASLNEIRSQGHCGSCWAFAPVSAMTDRVCIYSKGTQQFHFSAQDPVSCCYSCGFGCVRGSPTKAWLYWKKSGIVSGGEYGSKQGCRPYEIDPRIFHDAKTPPCKMNCETYYNVSYNQDKHFGKNVYAVKGGEEQIKAEIFTNGPVSAAFILYEDFVFYHKGVYKHIPVPKEFFDGHVAKIMGWGVENGTKYWLIANSWGTGWGDKGFIKFLRGEDHCEIESRQIVAGEPLLH